MQWQLIKQIAFCGPKKDWGRQIDSRLGATAFAVWSFLFFCGSDLTLSSFLSAGLPSSLPSPFRFLPQLAANFLLNRFCHSRLQADSTVAPDLLQMNSSCFSSQLTSLSEPRLGRPGPCRTSSLCGQPRAILLSCSRHSLSETRLLLHS